MLGYPLYYANQAEENILILTNGDKNMNRKIEIIIFLIILGLFGHSEAQNTGLIPVPIFTDAKIQSQIIYDYI